MKRIVAAFITIALMLSMTACMFGGKRWYTSSYICYIQEKAVSSLSGESSTDEKLGETRLNTYANVLVSDNIINAVITIITNTIGIIELNIVQASCSNNIIIM